MDEKNRTTVLCVDDDANSLELLAIHLRRRYEVLTAASGAAALELLHQNDAIAVIISDMQMPGMTGAVFLSALSVGMVFADDVKLADGRGLFASRGYVVTSRFVERACNFRRGTVREPLRVVVPQDKEAQPS